MDITEGVIAAIAAGFSGWAAFAAMKAAKSADRNSQTANRTAELAYRTAESVARIERDRWHSDLTPKIAFRLTKERGHQELLVKYTGPSSLGTLTSLTLRVRDDRDRSNDPVLGGGPTAEERALTIYGPYRFRHSTDGADETGRSVEPISLPPGEVYRLAMDPTMPPRYYGQGTEHWQRERHDSDLRLWVDCHVDGHKPWTLTADVPQRLGESLGEWTPAV
ncbi:hypothetical protein OG280_41000 (plasmid) [Streptomyces virginiae]|uniref:hypothetical protein n=1 Tax=Streptomyces virginiae TaxID=1961 RepID=UPI002DDB7AD9|nr:hypothetical protein [Streptomyces virginiae]WSC82727.1 hypothetical protein OHA56_41260 [Streptomyces virginiae]